MANTNKTKAEILQELESIKGLLLEEDGIPILQDMESEDEILDEEFQLEPPLLTTRHDPTRTSQHESVLPGQGLLFNEQASAGAKITHHLNSALPVTHTASANALTDNRPLAKASGENPFLPQHIRERLHGNNPPPLFEYETAKKIIGATKNIANKINKPRQYLVEEVMLTMMPQIERELRQRLISMSVEDLEKLLTDDVN